MLCYVRLRVKVGQMVIIIRLKRGGKGWVGGEKFLRKIVSDQFEITMH